MSNLSTMSPSQTNAGDNTSTSDTTFATERDDSVTVVSTIDFPSRSATEVHWTPRSRFLRIYNTANFRPAAPFAYAAGDFEANWASNPGVPQGGTDTNVFTNFLNFVNRKIKSFVERLARLTFPTA